MMLSTLPLLLRESLADFGLEAVDRWWTELQEPARRDVIQLWEEANLGGRNEAYVEVYAEDEAELNPALWHDDFYEYLVGHEAYYVDPAGQRIFHVACTRHPVARAAVQSGRIPADFACPWHEDDTACPMRTLLQRAAGRSVRLQIAWRSGSISPCAC
jgi:hypothetical protein